MRPFYWKNKKIPVYGSSKTIRELKKYPFVLKVDTVISL